MEHMRCMDKRQICGSMSRGEPVNSAKHLISESVCRPSLASLSGNSLQLHLMNSQESVINLGIFMCSHGSKVTLYKLYVSKDGQPLRLHMDG